MNKQGIEIMSDINLHVGVLEMELENCNEMLAESMKEVEKLKKQNNDLQEELNMEKEENELYMEYLDVSDAEEAKRKFSKYLSRS
jgi:predicted nuclease with TOPRIM domain